MNTQPRSIYRWAPLAALALIFPLVPGCGEHASANAAAGLPPPPFEVTVVRVEPRDIPWTTVHLAQTAASRAVEVRARVQGILVERAFTEGAIVHQGDVLYRIDARPFEAAKQAAEAVLAQARANVEQAGRTVTRKEQLVATDAIARRELDDALTAQALANAQVANAQAQLDAASLNLEFTTVTAPLDGRIDKVVREQGTMVDTNLNSLLTTIWRIDPIYVSFRVSEREVLDAARARRSGEIAAPGGDDGLRVAVELIDGTQYPHEGAINFHSVQVDPATGTAEVRAELANPEEALVPGQFVRAHVVGLTRRDALTVPQRAVQMGQQSSFVYVVGKDDKVEVREVALSTWEGADWLVESGIAAGERVIVDGIQKVRPGSVVKPVEAPAQSPAQTPAQAPAQAPAQK